MLQFPWKQKYNRLERKVKEKEKGKKILRKQGEKKHPHVNLGNSEPLVPGTIKLLHKKKRKYQWGSWGPGGCKGGLYLGFRLAIYFYLKYSKVPNTHIIYIILLDWDHKYFYIRYSGTK